MNKSPQWGSHTWLRVSCQTASFLNLLEFADERFSHSPASFLISHPTPHFLLSHLPQHLLVLTPLHHLLTSFLPSLHTLLCSCHAIAITLPLPLTSFFPSLSVFWPFSLRKKRKEKKTWCCVQPEIKIPIAYQHSLTFSSVWISPLIRSLFSPQPLSHILLTTPCGFISALFAQCTNCLLDKESTHIVWYVLPEIHLFFSFWKQTWKPPLLLYLSCTFYLYVYLNVKESLLRIQLWEW